MVHGKTFSIKAHKLYWFPVKDIKISDNFYKIQNFLITSWASVITHKDLLHLIIWMYNPLYLVGSHKNLIIL